MTARAIVSGTLSKQPMRKASSKGTAYLLATVREGKGDDARFWSAFVFSSALMEEIAQTQIGEAVSVAGEFTAEIYRPEGKEPRVSYKIMVDAVLTARRPKKQREEKLQTRSTALRPKGDFSDDIPF
jgi:hypothetical protein